MDVFVSRPTWIDEQFVEGSATFNTHLENIGLIPRTLGVTDYPSKSPLDEVISILRCCNGAIILGYPQLNIEAASLKGEPTADTLHLATEWNHIEAALAYSMGLPLLVIHHKTVSRGIFDRGVLNAFIHSVDLSLPNWSLQSSVNGAIKNWKSACTTANPNFSDKLAPRLDNGTSTKHVCPNCSTAAKPYYMRPVPNDFIAIVGGEWECANCKYVEQPKGP